MAPIRATPEVGLAALAPALLFVALCIVPYGVRLRGPSLYADDVDRIAQLQTVSLGRMLFLPFNEHVAPLFQAVTWASWEVAGHRLARVARVLTLASFLPLIPTLGLIVLIVRRETRSTTAAMAGVAIFSLSWLAIETVYWYSASSFLWALLATLFAWHFSEPESSHWRRSVLAALSAAAAPAFSAIGLLAGPLATVRVLASPGHRRLQALWPLLGTGGALALYALSHDHTALASNVGRSADVGTGLFTALRAPMASLVPALFGIRTWQATGLVALIQAMLSLFAAAGLLILARRPRDRPLLLGGLLLTFGGYALTFCPRAGEPGRALLETQRYHLFPMLGLVFVVTGGLRPLLARCDARPVGRFWGAAAFAAVLLLLHYPEMKGRARFLRFPDQGLTLASIDHAGALCRNLGIGRDQALAALDPIEPSWSPIGRNALVLLRPCAEHASLPDPLVRPTLLASLAPDDRRALCGMMDATPYLRRRTADDPPSIARLDRPIARYRMREVGAGAYVASGRPSFLEYELESGDMSDILDVPGLEPARHVEIWWRGDRQSWSEARSVRLVSESSEFALGGVLPLERLPHWDHSAVRRVRIFYHEPGPIALSAPKALR